MWDTRGCVEDRKLNHIRPGLWRPKHCSRYCGVLEIWSVCIFRDCTHCSLFQVVVLSVSLLLLLPLILKRIGVARLTTRKYTLPLGERTVLPGYLIGCWLASSGLTLISYLSLIVQAGNGVTWLWTRWLMIKKFLWMNLGCPGHSKISEA